MPWDRHQLKLDWATRPPRKCNACGVEKPIGRFYLGNGTCKTCYAARVKRWQEENPERAAAAKKKWDGENKEKRSAGARKRRPGLDRTKINQQARLRSQRLRMEALAAYGGKCACCGESHPEFLTFDHINDDGAQHRREIRSKTIYRWLRDNKYPQGQIVIACMNCNSARAWHGYCPHQREKKDGSPA